MTISNWGGKRAGAGRKQEKTNVTRVIRIDEALIPLINDLKERHKQGESLESLIEVTKNQATEQQTTLYDDPTSISIVTDLQDKIRQLEAEKQISDTKLVEREEISLQRTLERDKEHLKVINATSKLESLRSSHRLLKSTHDDLLRQEHDCMAITGSGERCTKKSTNDTLQNSILIHVCLQHAKTLAKKMNNKKVT